MGEIRGGLGKKGRDRHMTEVHGVDPGAVEVAEFTAQRESSCVHQSGLRACRRSGVPTSTLRPVYSDPAKRPASMARSRLGRRAAFSPTCTPSTMAGRYSPMVE